MKTSLYSLITCTVVLSTLYGCSANQAKENSTADAPVVVKTRKVSSQTIAEPVVASGLLASKKEVKLSFKTGGIIAAIRVDEGQSVKKGQLLASLNLTEINAQVKGAEQNHEKALRDQNRVKNLYADSAATLEQVQNATTGLEVTAATLQSARFNQQYSTIYAPENGQILKRFSETGELVSAGAPVFVFAASGNEQWVIRTGVSDRNMVRLAAGDKATVQFDAYPETDFTARVTEIAQVADPAKGTFEIELWVDPQGKKLATGMVANVQIIPTQTQACLMVPIEALIEADGNRGYVYVLNSDKQSVKKVAVKIAGIYDSLVGISEGLTDQATIITAGNHYLTQQSKVKIVD